MMPDEADLSLERRMALLADQRARWLNGQTIGVEHYLDLDPSLLENFDLLLDLIAQEALLDSRRGDDTRAMILANRFPRLSAWILDQFAIEQILAEFRMDSERIQVTADETARPGRGSGTGGGL